MAGNVNLDAGIFFREVRQQFNRLASAAFCFHRGRFPVFLHLRPFAFSGKRSRNRLEQIIRAVEHEIFRGIEHPAGRAARKGVTQNILQRRPVISLPDKGEGIDLLVE